MTRNELEERLIDFGVLGIEISGSLLKTKAGNHLSGQLARSSTAPALNYGEAQDAESDNDFVHKLKIVLKELRETLIALKLIHKARLCKSGVKIQFALNECDELVSIFVKSIETKRANMQKGQKRLQYIVNRRS